MLWLPLASVELKVRQKWAAESAARFPDQKRLIDFPQRMLRSELRNLTTHPRADLIGVAEVDA